MNHTLLREWELSHNLFHKVQKKSCANRQKLHALENDFPGFWTQLLRPEKAKAATAELKNASDDQEKLKVKLTRWELTAAGRTVALVSSLVAANPADQAVWSGFLDTMRQQAPIYTLDRPIAKIEAASYLFSADLYEAEKNGLVDLFRMNARKAYNPEMMNARAIGFFSHLIEFKNELVKTPLVAIAQSLMPPAPWATLECLLADFIHQPEPKPSLTVDTTSNWLNETIHPALCEAQEQTRAGQQKVKDARTALTTMLAAKTCDFEQWPQVKETVLQLTPRLVAQIKPRRSVQPK